MNLITLLGAAVGSEEFCELLFKDPLRAARSLNLVLTESELYQLRQTFTRKKQEELCGQFTKIRAMLCKRPPCPYVAVGNETGRERKNRPGEIAKQKAAAA